MRAMSKKRRAREAEARPFRLALIRRVGHCEICGAGPWHVRPNMPVSEYYLAVHEVARGPHRSKALDKPFSVLVVCNKCHMGPLASRAEWPEARQLAALKRSRPSDHDLAAYNSLVGLGPNRVTEEDIAKWL